MNEQPEDEVDEIVYQLDEDGFLLDENGNYILGDSNQRVQLTPEQIQDLQKNGIYEEDD